MCFEEFSAKKEGNMSDITPKVIIRVSDDGSRLVTQSGQTLYRFMPQRYDPSHSGKIPWMANFYGFMEGWMGMWSPLTGDPQCFYEGTNPYNLTQSDFSKAVRDGNPKKGEQQIMFRYWYLYTFDADRPDVVNGEVIGMWQKVSPDLIDLRSYSSGDVKSLEKVSGGP